MEVDYKLLLGDSFGEVTFVFIIQIMDCASVPNFKFLVTKTALSQFYLSSPNERSCLYIWVGRIVEQSFIMNYHFISKHVQNKVWCVIFCTKRPKESEHQLAMTMFPNRLLFMWQKVTSQDESSPKLFHLYFASFRQSILLSTYTSRFPSNVHPDKALKMPLSRIRDHREVKDLMHSSV